jgi:uncharacterized protein
LTTRHTVALGALTVAALTSTLLATPAAAANAPAGTRIHDIQGTTRLSPLQGKQVTDVPGVVTGVRTYGSRGFWFQDPHPDGDSATSEGVFVYTGSTPTVHVGDAVQVSGRVSEYYPGGRSDGNQSLTEISSPEVTVLSSGNPLPAAFVLDRSTVPDAFTPQGDPSDDGGIERLTLQPERYALDRYESLEGMNVRVDDARVVGATTPYAELWITDRPDQNPSARGGTIYRSYQDQNSGRLKVESLVPLDRQPFPTVQVGDHLAGATSGPLDYDQYGGYDLAARTLGTVVPGGLQRETTRKQHDGELAVATYNVENLDPGDDQQKFDDLARGVVHNLASPDILALEEVQDNNGPTDDGTVAADQTLQKLVDAIAAAGGPRYAWRGIAPQNDHDGGEPGGNIRTVFLFNPDRVSFVDRPGGDATTPVRAVRRHGKASLSISPGRVAPGSPAWEDSRKPLAGEFRFRGEPVVVIANHFCSKGGDQSLHSRYQPPNRSSELQRNLQAHEVHDFVEDLLDKQKKANVVVLGDLNDYAFSRTAQILMRGGLLRDAVNTLPADQRYTYVYEGNSQVLDQTLVSPGIRRFDYDIVHVNAEFSDQTSDHDPQVLRFRP